MLFLPGRAKNWILVCRPNPASSVKCVTVFSSSYTAESWIHASRGELQWKRGRAEKTKKARVRWLKPEQSKSPQEPLLSFLFKEGTG